MSFVLAVGPFVPPVHGAALVTERVVAEIEAIGPVVRVHVGRSPFASTIVDLLARAARGVVAAWHCSRPSCRSVYLSMPAGPTVFFAGPVVLVARLRRRTIVLHHHSFAYVNRRSRSHALLFRLARRAVHVALCARMKAGLVDAYGVENVIVVSNAAVVEGRRASIPQDSGQLTLGHLSNLSVEKGLDVVLEVARRFAPSKRPVVLRLGGPAASTIEQRMIEEAGRELGSAFDYRDAVDPADIPAFYDGVDIFLFPSRYPHEAQPLVVLEALSFGVPCVTSAVGCLPEILGVTALTEADASTIVDTITADRVVRPTEPGAIRDVALAQLASMIDVLTGRAANKS